MKKLRRIAAITAALVILMNVPALADVRRDETVYALLEADGTVAQSAVVVRLSGRSAQDATEYGDVSGWRLLDGDAPAVGDGSLSWPAASITGSGIYYEIPGGRQAPIDIAIGYTLDGQRVSPDQLAGAHGHLAIRVTLTNRWKKDDGYEPLLCQVTFTLPSERFANVTGGGAHVMAGHSLTAVATLLPAPEASVTLEADVINLELEPIMIQVLPGSLTLPDEIGEGIDSLRDGTAELADGADALAGGARELAGGAGALAGGARELAGGADELARGIDAFARGIRTLHEGGAELEEGLSALSDGLAASAGGAGELAGGADALSGGLGALTPAGASLAEGLARAQSGAESLAGGVGALSDGLAQASALATLTAADAQALLGSAAPESPEYALLAKIAQLAVTVDALSANAPALADGLLDAAAGLSDMATGFDSYSAGVSESAGAAAALADSLRQLADGLTGLSAGLSQSDKGYAAYREGVLNLLHHSYKLISGSREYADGVAAFAGETDKLARGTDELAQGAGELAQGTRTLRDSVNDELVKNLGGDRAETVSFTDTRNAPPATQAFLMRTRAVRMPEELREPAETEPPTFWQRILALFGIQ
ncbi:MAG: hypothetical protein ACOX7W_07710 [Christensenellales bacterium]